MRVQGQLRMGYYPADPDLVRRITNLMEWPDPNHPAILLDPCCGEGEALQEFGPSVCRRYGIELAKNRYETTVSRLNCTTAVNHGLTSHVLHGAFEHAQISERCFSACWLNPPYDDELGGGARTEFRFLQKATRLLIEGGVLVFFFSSRALDARLCKYLRSYYEDLMLFDHPETDRPGYSYINVKIAIGRKRRSETSPGDSWWMDSQPFPGPDETMAATPWKVPAGREPYHWSMGGYTDEQLCELADRSALWQGRVRSGPIDIGRPLLPLKIGHIPMVLASGRLNGVIHDHLARAKIEKSWKTIETKVDEKGNVAAVVQREQVRLSIKCLSKREGRVSITSFGQEVKKDEQDSAR